MADDSVLMFGADLPGWAGLDRATDASGGMLPVAALARTRSSDLHGKRPNASRSRCRARAEKAEAGGLVVTGTGKLRTFTVTVPEPAIRAFLAGYDAALAAAKSAARAAVPAPDAAPVAPKPPIAASPPPASAPSRNGTVASPISVLGTRGDRSSCVHPLICPSPGSGS